MKLIIQIPCFNEATTLPKTLADLPRQIDGIDCIETLVVDDGSTDQTVAVALECGADHIVRHSTNRGLAGAFATGVDAALRLGTDLIVNTDADNQYPGACISSLVAPILCGESEIVIGNRQPWQNCGLPIAKRVLQAIGSRFVGCLAGRPVPDAVSGFRALSREAAMRLNIVTSFSYTIESLLQASEKGMAIKFIPVSTNPTLRKSRLFGSVSEFVLRSSATMLRVHAMFHPLRIFVSLATLLILAGAVPIVRFLWLALAGGSGGHIQSLVLGTALFIAGCVFLALGVIADLLSYNRRLLELTLEKVRRFEAGGTPADRPSAVAPGS
ncbi:MAG: glycosyltransferase family 2 protein [Pirellulales bacterium]|nr:glycosyltransferase family 2 protein [Pirellulales bacterium]